MAAVVRGAAALQQTDTRDLERLQMIARLEELERRVEVLEAAKPLLELKRESQWQRLR